MSPKRPFISTWGMTSDEWDAARERMRDLLRRVASKRSTVTYGEISLRVFNGHFSPRSSALSQMLEEVCRVEDATSGIMLASVVVRKDSGIPGDGYFVVADKTLGRDIDVCAKADRKRFWTEEVTRVWDAYAGYTFDGDDMCVELPDDYEPYEPFDIFASTSLLNDKV